MNRKGFTLVELLATLVVLGIVVGITVATITGVFKGTKEKTEEVFIGTIKDALDMYISSDARKLNYGSTVKCELSKTHGKVNLYEATDSVTFEDVIDSTYSPITRADLHNPANKDKDTYECFKDGNYGTLKVYRDDDYVYYYKISKSVFGCLNSTGDITNLPSECND